MKFDIKINTIKDVVKGIELEKILKHLGSSTPKSFGDVYEELVGSPIPPYQAAFLSTTNVPAPAKMPAPANAEQAAQNELVQEKVCEVLKFNIPKRSD